MKTYAVLIEIEAESQSHAAEWLDQAIGSYLATAKSEVAAGRANGDDFAVKLFGMVADHAEAARRTIRPVPDEPMSNERIDAVAEYLRETGQAKE
jgi:hypothetical protein